jgi:hypothetical protein
MVAVSVAEPNTLLAGIVVVASQVAAALFERVGVTLVPSRVSSMLAMPLVWSDRNQLMVRDERSMLGSPMNAGGV